MVLLLWACSSAGRAPALQAGSHRFDPGHVHQLNSRSLNHLRCNFYCTILVQFRYIRYNWSFWKFKAEANERDDAQPARISEHFTHQSTLYREVYVLHNLEAKKSAWRWTFIYIWVV